MTVMRLGSTLHKAAHGASHELSLSVQALRSRHTLITGISQQGKTTFEQIKMRAMIASGKAVIMGDPKGDAADGLDPTIVQVWTVGDTGTIRLPMSSLGDDLLFDTLNISGEQQRHLMKRIVFFATQNALPLNTSDDLQRAYQTFRQSDESDDVHSGTMKAVESRLSALASSEVRFMFSEQSTFTLADLTTNNKINMIAVNDPQTFATIMSWLILQIKKETEKRDLHTLFVIDEAQMLFSKTDKFSRATQSVLSEALLVVANRGYALTFISQQASGLPKNMQELFRNRVWFAGTATGQDSALLRMCFKKTSWETNTELALLKCQQGQCFVVLFDEQGKMIAEKLQVSRT